MACDNIIWDTVYTSVTIGFNCLQLHLLKLLGHHEIVPENRHMGLFSSKYSMSGQDLDVQF